MAPQLKTIRFIIISVCAALLGTALWLGTDLYRYAHKASGNDNTQLVFPIAQGEGFNRLAQRLHTHGIITSPLRFKLIARLKRKDKQLKAGEYRLAANMTPSQVLDVLVDGNPFLYRITIPEGFNLQQIADEINRQELANGLQFLALATDPQVASKMGVTAPTLEGYLFPDTYYFPKDVPPITILTKMVEHFREKFQAAWHQQAKTLNLTIHEVITLASIIEKETGAASERPIIASVFHNRLKKRMRLESDPTVIYGIKDFNGNLTRKNLRTHTPYNTYAIRGLPPGPIANPGAASIEAALFPAKSNYLFFVAKRDGTHQFSTNIKDHNQAVYKYQLRRKRKSAP